MRARHVEREHYDFIIVGGGSAGCALANRLSADPACSVLVLEAGRPDAWWDLFIHMPAAFAFPLGSRFYDWRYRSEPEPQLGGRRIRHPRGKVLGGSSSINGMIFQRGHPLDMERWAAEPGMASWDYAHTLPYFKRLESCLAGGDAWRGSRGPQKLERGAAAGPLFEAFFAACRAAGYPSTDDVNGHQQEGFARFDRTIHRGRRLSAARAYLHPVLGRPNLTVATRVHVNRILFEGRRAVGVETQTRSPLGRLGRMGPPRRYRGGELISCAGAIATPQLLQLSGVGEAGLLESLGIPVVADLPGVGANLEDHLEVYVQHRARRPVSQQPQLARWRRPWIGLQWLLGRGPAMTNHFEAGGFVRSNERVAYPNLMLHFLPLALRYDGKKADVAHGYQVHVGPMNAEARGSVRIRSRDPRAKPALRFNYLSTERDRTEWVEAVRITRAILSQAPLRPFDGGEISPGPEVESDAEILAWVARDAETALHPACSARMGLDPASVLDPETLRVHGTDGLRVVDASAMPHVTNGNLYAPVMMLAEKAADLILGREPLAPEDPGFQVVGPLAEPARAASAREG